MRVCQKWKQGGLTELFRAMFLTPFQIPVAAGIPDSTRMGSISLTSYSLQTCLGRSTSQWKPNVTSTEDTDSS
jgi:hypothetical protein